MTRERVDPAHIRWHGNARTDSSPIIRLGFWSVCVLMAVFLVWSLVFPLSSAVITPGTFLSQGRNKLVQHQTGGRVTGIFVREGDFVLKDQPVIEIDRGAMQADLTRLDARHASLSALASRLDAERSGGSRMGLMRTGRALTTGSVATGGFTLRGADGADVAIAPVVVAAAPAPLPVVRPGAEGDLLDSQRRAYTAGRELLEKRLDGLRLKAEAMSERKRGLQARIDAQEALQAMTRDELRRLKPLARDGYIARSRLEARARTLLELEGAITGLETDISSLDTQLAEVESEMRKAQLEVVETAAREYTRIVGELAEIRDARLAAKAAVAGAVLRAPVDGHITKLAVATEGGILGAGDVVAEIVPRGSPLVVEARVSPGDIDYVKEGQTADIVVTAFNRRIDDSLTGTVIYKAADAARDEKTGDPYFSVRLAIAPGSVDPEGSMERMKDVQAGMQGEVYIHTGARTFMTYLTKPMIDSFRRAFREM